MAEERRKAAWIGGSILVRGDVVSTEDLVIDGQVQGTIELGDHSLTIGQGASVVADLVAKMVTISGQVKGNVIGSGKVELKSGGKVEGDITAPTFVMEDGAALSGKVDTGTKKS
jgi:cytoskeletal protein CcmA (bactofilin family)